MKAVSWRILGTLDTFIISFLVTGSIKWAGSIASVESATKIILFYLHERAWAKFRPSGAGVAWWRPAHVLIGKLMPAGSLKLATASSSRPPEENSK